MKFPDWNDFNHIYAGRQTSAFEDLCRNLFRLRYNLPQSLGYFRNNAGNETEIIESDGELIGFNAKFFESGINAAEIIESLKTARKYNPGQTSIIIYTNKEFGNPKKGEDKTSKQQTIEAEAAALNLKIEWMFGQNILDAVIKSELLHNLFFNPDDNSRFLPGDIEKRNRRILRSIHTRAGEFSFPRDTEVESVAETLKRQGNIILTGCSGVGKSAVVRLVYEKISADCDIMILEGSAFDVKNVEDLLSLSHNHTLASLTGFYQDSPRKILVVDSADSIPRLNSNTVFANLVEELAEAGWQFIITVQELNLPGLSNWLNRHLPDHSFTTVEVGMIPDDCIDGFMKSLGVSPCRIEKIRSLLCIPFYLARFAELNPADDVASIIAFKKSIRDSKMCGADTDSPSMQAGRLATVFGIIKYCEKNKTLHAPIENFETNYVDKLLLAGVLTRTDGSMLAFSHDIYRDIAFEDYILRDFRNLPLEEFLDAHKGSLAAMFAFGSLVSDLAESGSDMLFDIIDGAFSDQYPKGWTDRIFAEILQSSYADEFIGEYGARLSSDNNNLLTRMIHILITQCQQNKSVEIDGKPYTIKIPKGKGWKALIYQVGNAGRQWKLDNIELLLNFFMPCTRLAECDAKLIVNIGKQVWQCYILSGKTDAYDTIGSKFRQLVCYYAICLERELKELMENWQSLTDNAENAPLIDLVDYLATTKHSFSRMSVAEVAPLSYLGLIDTYWTQAEDDDPYYGRSTDCEHAFGINSEHADFDFFPCSPLQTPVGELLKSRPDETLQFIIRFFNRCTHTYIENNCRYDEQCVNATFVAPDGTERSVLASDNLWCMYRDSSNLSMPDLLKSILMALENYMLEECSQNRHDKVRGHIDKILCESECCAPIAVAASVVTALPDRFFEQALSLFSSHDFLSFDNHRCVREAITVGQNAVKYMRNPDMLKERKTSSNLPHRQVALENICLKYQIMYSGSTDEGIRKRLSLINATLDRLHDYFNSLSDEEKATCPFGFLLARIDLRKATIRRVMLDDGREGIEVSPRLPEAQKELSQRFAEESSDLMKYSSLPLWARYEYQNSPEADRYPYHDSPLTAYGLMQELLVADECNCPYPDNYFAAIIAAVLLTRFQDALDDSRLQNCLGIVREALRSTEMLSDIFTESEIILSAFPVLADHAVDEKGRNELVEILLPYLGKRKPPVSCKRIKDKIGDIFRASDFHVRHEALLNLLIEKLVTRNDDGSLAVEDEDTADSLLCILPNPTPGSARLELSVKCIASVAAYFDRQAAERYPDSNLELAFNAGRYIAAADASLIPDLLEIVKDSLCDSYLSEQFLTGLLFNSYYDDKGQKWRLACDILLDRIADIERRSYHSKLTPIFMLNPVWLRPIKEDAGYDFNRQDLEHLRLFIEKIEPRPHILDLLLNVAATIGAAFRKQFLPLVARFTSCRIDREKAGLIRKLEEFMTSLTADGEALSPCDYERTVSILNFMIENGSAEAARILREIRR